MKNTPEENGGIDYWRFCFFPEKHCPYPENTLEYKQYMKGWENEEDLDFRLDEW